MMKKIFVTLMMCVLAIGAASAQALDAQRAANLEKLVKEAPKPCGIAQIDEFATQAGAAALLAVANSAKLIEMNKAIEAGNLPSLADVTTLAAQVKAEQEAAKAAGEAATKAADGLKAEMEKAKSGGMKEKLAAGKKVKDAKKVVEYGNEAMQMLVPETAAQGLAIAAIMQKVK